MKKTKKLAFGGMPAPMAKPMGPSMGPKPQIMGGSSNKMGPDSMKTGVPSNPARMMLAPGATGPNPGYKGFNPAASPGVQKFTGPMSTGPKYDSPTPGVMKFTGPPIIKTAKNFEGLTPGGRPIVNPINNPAVQKFTGPMSTGPRFDKPAPVTPGGRPTINPNSPGVMKAPTMPPMTKGPMAGDMGHAGRLKKGGEVKASKRADGCAIRGKTKGRMV